MVEQIGEPLVGVIGGRIVDPRAEETVEQSVAQLVEPSMEHTFGPIVGRIGEQPAEPIGSGPGSRLGR